MPSASVNDLARAERVLVYGVTGSGKSTAAVRLGAAAGLPVHLVDDEIGWLPGWVNRSDEEMRSIASDLVAQERWIFDSAYGSFLDVVMARADVIVALDYPRLLSLGRLLRRTVRRALLRETACNGNRESLGRVFSRDSIVRWHFRSFTRKRERVRQWEAAPDGVPVLRLTHPREFDRLVDSLGQVEARAHPGAEG